MIAQITEPLILAEGEWRQGHEYTQMGERVWCAVSACAAHRLASPDSTSGSGFWDHLWKPG